jgi:LacI family transcriptional regulator
LVINAVVKPSRDVMLATAGGFYDNDNVRLRFFYGSPATSLKNLVEFVSSGLDGVLICGFHRKFMVDFVNAAPSDLPIVLCLYAPIKRLEMHSPGRVGTVILDNELAGRMAADYFLVHGLQHFGFMGCNIYREKLSSEARGNAFRRRIEECGVFSNDIANFMFGHSAPNEDFWNSERSEVVKWLKGLPHPCGLFVNGEIEAYALLKICRQIGLEVPGQIEVLCVDNSYGFCERAKPTLSHVHFDLTRAVGVVIGMLLSMIDDPNLPEDRRKAYISTVSIVERGSTASGRGYGLLVERAREYVRLNACKGISVADVARHFGVSMRTLEHRVHVATGSSVHTMIQSVKLEHVCQLLKTTDLPIAVVAERTGYRLATTLGALFTKTFGMSMREYRAKNRG